MSIVDQVVSALTPPESDDARAEATQKARGHATPGDWLSQILDHHDLIREQFVAAKRATTVEEALATQKRLAKVLVAHSIAEEVAIYPAIAAIGDTGHATMAYTEQSAAKMQMGLLERLEPLSQDYVDKLGHIEGAVLHHIYEEEGTWFIDLKEQAPDEDQARAAHKYREIFDRNMGTGDGSSTSFISGGETGVGIMGSSAADAMMSDSAASGSGHEVASGGALSGHREL